MATVTRIADSAMPIAMDWHLDSVVAHLRELRKASLAARQRLGKPVKLPSRTALADVVEQLSAALFPNRLSSRTLAHENENIDYFVGHTIDTALHELAAQVLRELQFVSGQEGTNEGQHNQVVEIVREFASNLPAIRALLETDIYAAFEGDPAARGGARSGRTSDECRPDTH